MSLLAHALQVAVRRLRTNPLRGTLVLLQVLLGTLAMTVVLSAYRHSLAAQGPEERFSLVAGTRSERMTDTYLLFDRAALSRIPELAPAVQELALYRESYRPMVEMGDTHFQFRTGAFITPGYFRIHGIEVSRGSLFSQADIEQGNAVALISDAAASVLFPDADPVGQQLSLLPQRLPLEIVGTYRKPTGASEHPALLLPASEALGGMANGRTSVLNALAQPGEASEAREQVLAATRRVYSSELRQNQLGVGEDLFITTSSDVNERPTTLDPDLVIFGLFGIVALVVGSIGVFSMTLVETIERQHEIGLRRTLGATRGRIGLEFMLENGVLVAIGAVLGAVAALLVTSVMGSWASSVLFEDARFTFDPVAALWVIALAVFLGCVFSLLPALQAGRMRPAEALRGA